MVIYLPSLEIYKEYSGAIELYGGMLFCDAGIEEALQAESSLPVLVLVMRKMPAPCLQRIWFRGVTGACVSDLSIDLMELKRKMQSGQDCGQYL